MTMHATAQAFRFLEDHATYSYEELCAAVLDAGGYMVQTPDYFVAFTVCEREALVLFACGNLRGLIAYARMAGKLYGFDRVTWTRSLVNKRVDYKTYDLLHLTKHE